MPQLNPNPWLFIMLTTWLTFSLVIQPKIMSMTSPNQPHIKATTINSTTPWTWPWA